MTEPSGYTQPELDLEFTHYDHYTVTISKGAVGDMKVVREHQAATDADALNLIEGLSDTYGNRDNVTWRDQEMPDSGVMYGLAPGGVVYEILVVPPLGSLA